MLPEAMFWLLLTGRIPSTTQIRAFSRELNEKSKLPDHVDRMAHSLEKTMHPMAQLSILVTALSHTSVFASAYQRGISKGDYWEYIFDDCISLIAKLPKLAGIIYRRAFGKKKVELVEGDSEQDWAYGYAVELGKGGPKNENFQDLLRLYLALHGDHEGGNVSAHATHLVGSALSDPFLSYSAGLQGLAGPLHG